MGTSTVSVEKETVVRGEAPCNPTNGGTINPALTPAIMATSIAAAATMVETARDKEGHFSWVRASGKELSIGFRISSNQNRLFSIAGGRSI